VSRGRTHVVSPDLESAGSSPGELLRVENLVKHFPVRSGVLRRRIGDIRAVDGVDLTILAGQTVGLVGESGCGKTTLARTILRLLRPNAGRILLEGRDIAALSARQMRPMRRHLQMVFQDPYTSLNPGMTVEAIVSEPLRLHGRPANRAVVHELLETVGLSPEHGNRYPHEFSGGQRQRIGIARAIALNPRLLILDEPVSALDVSIQAQIINLLKTLQEQLHLTYLLIAHDLAVVRHASTRVAVMYLGKIVETGSREDVYERPSHPYTQALLSAIPPESPTERLLRRRIVLQGDPPNPAMPPSGCRFRTRCWKAQEICATDEPALIDRGEGHYTACHFAEPAAIFSENDGLDR
jgi:oligopeptide/dipeptide ABC transporter ATP-binding protein